MNDARARSIAQMLATIRAQDTDTDPFEVEAEDELPYVQLGHWIGLADVSAKAKELYWILAMHLNYKRGDRYVWPSTEILAMLLGYSRGDKITSFARELEAIGALKVIKVPDGKGPQKKNVYKLRRTPPDGYTGSRSLSEFYERLGRAYDGAVLDGIQHANSIKSAGQNVSPGSGGYVSPQLGADVGPQLRGHVTPQFGGITTRTLNYKKENEQAPSARSAGDARRATTGSRTCEPSGSAVTNDVKAPEQATSKKNQVRMTREQARAVKLVESAYPASLVAKMPAYRPPTVRDAILATLGTGPAQRTAEQIAARLERRWYAWSFADKDRQGEIRSYPGVVVRLISSQPCGNARCEDGIDIDDGEPCRACPERQHDRRSRPKSPVPGPRQQEATRVRWECADADCRRPGRGELPADGLCPDCRERAAKAAAAAQRLAGELARQNETRRHQASEAWQKVLDEAYAEHQERKKEQGRRQAKEAEEVVATAQQESDQAETLRLREQLAQEYPELAEYARR
ncbi:hypothetical protein ACWCP6_28595 [Streptomyces sp. NPDC002004]